MRLILVSALCVLASSCSRNPITGRSQMQLFNESDIQSMAFQQYKSFLQSNKVVKGTHEAEMIDRIGHKLSTAITAYYDSKGLSRSLEGFQWEYHLVDSREANAWCMPGGKIVVYSGLLPITRNENALAVVLGHEIAHALARHGNERMSQSAVQQLGGVALSVAITNKTREAQQLLLDAYGVGTTLGGTLPFSRKHELEADKLGLIYAAMAGFDPREAIPLWQRMAKGGNGSPPEFLSTHPAETTRIEKLKAIMPEAVKIYDEAKRKL